MVWRRDGETEPLEASVRLEGEPLRLGITWWVDEAEPGTIVLTHVVPGSPADRAGLAAGDRIYQVAGKDFPDDAAFARLVTTEPEPLVLLVERDGRLRTVTLHFSAQPAAPRRAA